MNASGSIFPSPDILNNTEYGKFVLSNLAAKRAKQIKDGAPPLVRIDSNHPLSIALAEIAAGKIKPVLKSDPDTAIEEIDLEIIDTTGAELGILLPALDEAEAEILGVHGLGADDPEEEIDADAASLSDLMGEDLAVETVADTGEDTLSLSDIAEKEESEADDDESED